MYTYLHSWYALIMFTAYFPEVYHNTVLLFISRVYPYIIVVHTHVGARACSRFSDTPPLWRFCFALYNAEITTRFIRNALYEKCTRENNIFRFRLLRVHNAYAVRMNKTYSPRIV